MKKLIAVSLIAASSMIATEAMADVSFQFRVPFVATSPSGVTNQAGDGFLLAFDVDSSTSVGILSEHTTYSDQKAAGAPPVAPTAGFSYDITAVRMQKSLTDSIGAGLDIGHITQNTNAAAVAGTGSMADVFANVKLVTSKGSKVNSFLSGEVLYRVARVNSVDQTDLGGVMLVLSAGVGF